MSRPTKASYDLRWRVGRGLLLGLMAGLVALGVSLRESPGGRWMCFSLALICLAMVWLGNSRRFGRQVRSSGLGSYRLLWQVGRSVLLGFTILSPFLGAGASMGGSPGAAWAIVGLGGLCLVLVWLGDRTWVRRG